MKNPFDFSGIVDDPAFCDREQEQKDLKAYIDASQNVLLFSHRRYGKTSLILKVFKNLKSISAVYVDLYLTTTIDEFLAAFIKGLMTIEPLGSRLGRKVKEMLSGLSLSFTIDPATWTPSVTPRIYAREKGKAIDEVFAILKRLSEKKKMVVAFDEFQEIAGYGESPFEKHLRSIIQHLRNVSFIYAGSQKHIITEMFGDSKRAFYHQAASYPLKRIATDDYVDWIVRLYSDAGRRIDPTTIEDVLWRCENHPAYIQEFFFSLWQERKVSRETIDKVEQKLVERHTPEYSKEWEALTLNQRRCLKLVAGTDGTNLYTADKLSMHGFRTASQLSAALNSLVTRGILEKNKAYKIHDPIFRRWLLSA